MRRHPRPVVSLALFSIAVWNIAWAYADEVQDKFHRAYFLENADRNFEQAAKLYAEVAADKSAAPELKSRARARLAAVNEERATADFASLMPPGVIVYVELNRPGDQLMSLAGKLGLLADGDSKRSQSAAAERRFGLSPELFNAVLGIRGIAVAVTGIDPVHRMPVGVAVIHPGSANVIRGVIETALPFAGKPADSIEGYATYLIENRVLVTLTEKLVIVSSQPEQIVDVVRRASGNERESLGTDSSLADSLKKRGDGSLLFCCVNPKPIMPMIKAGMAAGAMQAREFGMANALVDVDSLESVVLRFGVNDAGIALEASIRLAEGHRNLIYNFARMPAVDAETLKCVPADAAAFLVAGLNEPASRNRERARVRNDEAPIVTAMDIGREIFANIIGLAVFVLPPDDESAPVRRDRDMPPIPDVAAVLTVNDPAQSRALWTQMLGIASLAAGHGTLEGESVKLDGLDARAFKLPEGVTLYFAATDDSVILTPSKSALKRAAARHGAMTIAGDAGFSKHLARLSVDSSLGVFVHAGRCAAIARGSMDARDFREAEPFMELLGETAAALVVNHSDREFHLSLQVSGLPKIGGIVSQLISDELDGRNRRNFANSTDLPPHLFDAPAQLAPRGDGRRDRAKRSDADRRDPTRQRTGATRDAQKSAPSRTRDAADAEHDVPKNRGDDKKPESKDDEIVSEAGNVRVRCDELASIRIEHDAAARVVRRSTLLTDDAESDRPSLGPKQSLGPRRRAAAVRDPRSAATDLEFAIARVPHSGDGESRCDPPARDLRVSIGQ